MSDISAEELARVNSFPKLVALLRDKLEWPIDEDYEFEDVIFEYDPHELGLKEEETAKVREIHQLRPLVTNQPWGVFFISFEEKQLSVTVLRRILRALVVKQRGAAVDRQAWDKSDLIFAANFGKSGARELAFVHFSDGVETGDLPVMKVLGWNAKDTKLHNNYAAEMLTSRLTWPADQSDSEAWRKQWSSAFEIGYRQVIRTSRELALHLAGLATQIRARANELLEAEADDGPMRTMLEAFRKNLIHDLDGDGFADMFAQTICYGMLAAAISRESGALVADNMADMVPRTNPFLKELFANFLKLGGRDKRSSLDFDELGVREVVDMLQSADMPAVLRDFGDRNPKEDPVIHFYELFLKEYDSAKRMQRGVFYTPRPVVSFIVRGVDELLRTAFDLPLGLADTTTWGELAERNEKITVPDHIDRDQPFVQILDPATGTGTFLVEVIDLIHKRMVEHWEGEGKSKAEIAEEWNVYVPVHLLPRLTAFELMMAPYAIAHMKVGLKLTESGYRFGSDERARIFLSNALEPARDPDSEFSFMAEALAHEVKHANQAKTRRNITVVVGNPPYSENSKNRDPFIERIMDDFKKTIRDEEAQIKAVSNDYVKFIRLSSYCLQSSGYGVFGLITSSGYLDGPLFRDCRKYMVDNFDQVSITNLHGSVRRGDNRTNDENVFEIQQGVAVNITMLNGSRTRHLEYAELVGAQEQKLTTLLKAKPGDLQSIGLDAEQSGTPFVPRKAHDEAVKAWPINEIFGTGNPRADRNRRYGAGFKSRQDRFTIGLSACDLEQRIAELADDANSEERLVRKYRLCSTAHFEFEKARKAAKSGALTSSIDKIRYRPFDDRPMIWHRTVMCEPQEQVTKHLFQDNLCLSVTRVVKDDAFRHVLVCAGPVEVISLSTSTSTNAYMFPLKFYDELYDEPLVNLNPKFTRHLSDIVGLPFENLARDLSSRIAPRDIFDWIYAILHSPLFREANRDQLRSDFPRIPTPRDRATFAALVPLGRRLVALHLLRPEEEPILKNPDLRFAGTGDARVEMGYPKYKNGKVEINANRWFEDVPKETWEFHVGGYQVCDKWLKDRAGKGGQNPRPGRVLTDNDILHYRRVVTALTETRRIMAQIDEAIEKHGGWPGAFTIDGDCTSEDG